MVSGFTGFIDAKGQPSQNKPTLNPGWAAFFGFIAYHADALGLVPAPFPVPTPVPATEGGQVNA